MEKKRLEVEKLHWLEEPPNHNTRTGSLIGLQLCRITNKDKLEGIKTTHMTKILQVS